MLSQYFTQVDLNLKLGFWAKASFSLLLTILDVINLITDMILVIPVIVGETADNLKAFLCESNWWDHSFTISKYC